MGANAYTGATSVDGGATLSGADGANAFSAASATTVNGTLDLGGNNQTLNSLAGTGAGGQQRRRRGDADQSGRVLNVRERESGRDFRPPGNTLIVPKNPMKSGARI
jgi:hypothetical protein